MCCGAHLLKDLHRDWNSVMAVLEMWGLLPVFSKTFCGGRYAAQSLLSQCFIFTSAPTWSIPHTGDGAASQRDWKILPGGLSLTALTVWKWELPAEECSQGFLGFPQCPSGWCPSCCSELGGTRVPWIRNCQLHLLRGYIFSSSQWSISRMIQTWM